MPDQADNLRLLAGRLEASGELRSEQRGRRRARMVAVTGGKGGVGKTNIAVCLALALAEAGARTLLFDADLGLANVDVLLGLDPAFTLQHVVHRQVALAEVLLDAPHGLQVLPGGTGLQELANLGTLEIVRLLSELRSLEQSFDMLVIDTAAGISNLVTRFALAADDVVVVSMPEPPAMLDAYGVMKALANGQLSGRLHLVVNMVGKPVEAKQTHRTLAAVARTYLKLDLNLLGYLSRDEAVPQSVIQQKPFILARPNCLPAQQLRAISRYFLEGLVMRPASARESFFARFLASMR